mmetsp:Transcript_104036/g.294262  ORF Transcript_104036/g.294262 Transcript_104036/m.294262 type:complete len:256 (-) Transcript_104036:44-811(-)|eukprot:CAMPEP_0168453400 /NCGR_PEP_ID=MMETSP0228-20121227/49664_1 /TAXON_ID=133427 /ORGANISM="Protoceratium reticulatum, Strain CCCM 535 (=CCMP 1889)" /LENGTH=255 /DNA_ID=CAMNT_0008468111 /DNA_START=63 /DNA_END=830 /DNA_ORIENTATION=+
MAHERRADLEAPLDPDKQWDLLRAFPMAFTICCLLLFTGPVVKCADVFFCEDCRYWLGPVPQVLCFMPPIMVAVAQVMHNLKGAPWRPAVILALMGPSAVLVVLCERVMVFSRMRSAHLVASDCRSMESKQRLENSWKAAREFQTACRALPGAEALGIEECPHYEHELYKNPDWAYLKGLELRHLCGGWCENDAQIWGLRDDPISSCSVRAGEALHTKVGKMGTEVFVYSILLIIVTVMVLVHLGPAIRSLGVAW